MLSETASTDTTTAFYVSKEWIQKRLTRMFVREVFILLALVYMFFSYSNIGPIIFAIAISPSTVRGILHTIF
jgi:hypothetical protein